MSENNVTGIIGAEVTTTGIIGATVAIGQYIVNDYVITIAPVEDDYGYTMTITRGSDTQTVTLYGLSTEQYNSMLGYLQQAQEAAQNAAGSASDAADYMGAAAEMASNATTAASRASSRADAAASYASQAQQSANSAASAKTDAQTARTQAQGYRQAAEDAATRAETAATRAETSAEEITGMTAEAETLEPGSPATASFLDGVLSLGIPAGANGAAGNGIVSIVKTGTSGNIDTYTITYTNGTTSTFTVRNGVDGAVTSVAGKTGAVTLDAGDVAFDDQETYNDGTVGAGLTNLLSALNTAISGTNGSIVKGGVAFPSSFVFGTLDNSGQIAAQSANRRCVTEQYMSMAEDNIIKIEAGYSIILCIYNSDYTLKSRTIYNGATSINLEAETIFRVCILLGGTEVVISSPYQYIDKAYLILPYVNTLANSVSSLESATSQNTADIASLSQSVSSMFDNETEFVDVEDATHTEGGFIRTSGNLDPVSGYSYFTVPCQAGDIFDVTSFAGSAARLWLVKSASNTVLDYSSDSSAPSLKHETVTIPTNGATLIVNTGNGSATIKKADIVRVIKEDLLPAQKNNRLYGKVYCAVGDSITYGEDMDADGITQTSTIEVHQWSGVNSVWNEVTSNFRHSYAYQIAERNNMVLWNGGVSGSTMQGIEARRGFSLANGRYTQLPDSIDYLTIFFGWNDTAYGTLGTITDTTNESYYGGYNVVLPYLINKYPYSKIALIVPFGTDEGHRNAIRQLGNKWGVAVWDNYQGGTPLYYGKEDSVGVESSIVTANRAKFQANGAHPNYKGHTQLADMIEEFLRGI